MLLGLPHASARSDEHGVAVTWLDPPTQDGLARVGPSDYSDADTLVSSSFIDDSLFTVPSTPYHSDMLATGRGLTYEWEHFMADVLNRLDQVEAGGTGGGGEAGAVYVWHQNAAAATWTITHNMATKPVLAVVSEDGDLLYAEVTYPDDNHIVITFGMPYAGTAYLRG